MAIHPMGREPLVATGQLGGKTQERAVSVLFITHLIAHLTKPDLLTSYHI